MLKAEMRIIDILELYPETKRVFVDYGMECSDCMGAEIETLEKGAQMHGIDLSKLLDSLNRIVGFVSEKE